MLNSKLHDYCARMSIYELNRFRKFVHSPLHNEDGNIKQLVDTVLPYIKEGNWEIEPQKIWKAIFNSPFNQGKYTRLLSDTVKKVEQFLVLDDYNQQDDLRYAAQLGIMNQRKLDKHVPEFMKVAFQKQQALPLRDAAFYYSSFLLQQQKNLFLENKEQRSPEKNLQDVTHSLDVFYLVQKLKYSAAILHYKNFVNIEGEIPFLETILKQLEREEYNIPAIQIYRRIILSFLEPANETHYQKLKELLTANDKLFGEEELKSMFVFAMNYCINQINFGKAEYLKEILELYKYALQRDLLLENGFLSQWDYKNIVTTALRVKEFKWAETFLNEYKPKLPKADRQNAYTFNLARYYFAIKKYDEVLRLLQDVKYNDIFYQLDSKTTLLKTYYELGEWQPLYSLKDSFRILLRRKKLITEQQKENYLNLLKLSIKLFNIDVKDWKALAELKEQIEQTQNVADKSWLVEKVGELT